MGPRGTIALAIAASLPVATGLWLTLRYLLPPIHAEPTAFALACSAAVVLLAFVPGIEAVAHERLFHASIDPLAGKDSRRLVVNQRYLQNTLEQLVVLIPGLILLARDTDDLSSVAATATVWTVGRWTYWIGYHLGPIWRGLGVFTMFLGLAVLVLGVGRFGYELGGWAGVALLLGPFAAIEAWLFATLARPARG